MYTYHWCLQMAALWRGNISIYTVRGGAKMGEEIRVVNATQSVQDVLSFSEAELGSLLSDLVAELDGGAGETPSVGNHATKRAILRFGEVAKLIRLKSQEAALPDSVDIIAARQLLRDRGVTAHGTNVTTQSPTAGNRGRSSAAGLGDGHDLVRSAVRKELWVDTPPKQSAGWSYASWATAAAAEDRIDLENFVVQPSLVGPSALGVGTPLADSLLTARFSIAALMVGTCIPNLLTEAGRVLAAPGRHWVEIPAVQRELLHLPPALQAPLKRILQLVASMAVPTGTPDQPTTRQLFEKSRLNPDSYTAKHPDAEFVAPERIADLSRAINEFRSFAQSATATLVVWGETTASFLPPPEADRTPNVRVVPPPKDPEQTPVVSWPICPSSACVDARRSYEGVLAQALDDILAARAQQLSIPELPMNYINAISNFGGELMVRNLLVDTEESLAEVERYLAQLKNDQKAERLQTQLLANAQQKMVQARQYLVIIEEKLGSTRFSKTMEELVSNPIKYDIDNPQDVLLALRKAGNAEAARLVETEYANRDKAWELETNNKCAHVSLVRSYRAVESLAQKGRIMRQIMALLNDKGRGRKNWLSCKNCSFRAICPHVLVLHELQQREADFGEIRKQLHKYASPVRYSESDITPNYSVFCSICSEELYIQLNDDFNVEMLGLVGSMEGDLKRFLWKSMMQILTGADSAVSFDRPVDTSRFSAEAVDVCHPLVVTGKFQGRSRSMTKDQRERWQQLSGLVYLYAFLFAVALKVTPRGAKAKVSNAVGVIVNTVSDQGRTRVAKNPDEIAKALLVNLVKSNSLLISQLETVTNEQIGNQFRDAYAHIQNTHGRLHVSSEDTARVFLTSLVELDPFFRLLKNTVRTKFWQIDSQKKAADAFLAIMGRSLEFFLTEGSGNNLPSEFGPFIRTIMTRRGGIEYPAGVAPKWVYGVPDLQLYKYAFKNFASRSGSPKKYWAKVKAASKPLSNLAGYAGGGARLSTKVTDADRYNDAFNLALLYAMVSNDEEEAEFQEILTLARRREQKVLDRMKLASFPPQTNFTEAVVSEYTPYETAPLARLYDEEGTPHDWSVYIWTKAGADEKALSRKEILKIYQTALESGKPSELQGYESTDQQCSGCGVRWSDVDKLDAGLVEKNLKARLKLGGFFMYYESRCPVEGLHEFAAEKNEMRCKKCGIASELLSAVGRKNNMEDALAFFSKYEKAFSQTMAPDQALASRVGNAKKTAEPAPPSGDWMKLVEQRDYDQILGLAAFLEIGAAEIEALGSGDGRTYDEVKSGKNAPPPPDNLDDPRLLAVDNIFRDMMVRYCTLYFQQKNETDSPSVASPEKLEASKLYYEPYKAYKAAARADSAGGRSAALMTFSVESFCRLVLKARDLASSPGKALVKELAKDIIVKESFFTLAGDFQWSLFGDDETRSNSVNDSTHDDPRRYGEPDGAEDVISSLERAYARGEEGVEKSFSLDSLDVDKATVDANLDN